jgi:thiol-disulfide isomerase/thioredoxin
LVDNNGNAVSLKQYKGKLVFVNFWASWCPPCIAEMPSMYKLYDEYQDEFFFVCHHGSLRKSKCFFNQRKLKPTYLSFCHRSAAGIGVEHDIGHLPY